MNGLVIDVEATAQTPVLGAMIQIGCVDLNGNEFYAEFRPEPHHRIERDALDSIGLTLEEIMEYPPAHAGMQSFIDWLDETYKGKRVPVWSDNPGFDWQFVNGYLWKYCRRNPLGWSMRRIGDFYAGMQRDARATSKWKKLRDTKHTHNALDDARGNAEALKKILDWTV